MKPIIYFDGICNLCDGFIDFVVRHDSENTFLIASLQGNTASRRLTSQQLKELSTIVVETPNGFLYESQAIFFILERLPRYRWIRFFKLLPNSLNNLFYRLVARSRYFVFGKRDVCRMPTPEEKQKFLE